MQPTQDKAKKGKKTTMNTRKYVATFTEGLLGTKPNDESIHETYVAAKRAEGIARDEIDAEKKTLECIERLEKGKTVFHRDAQGRPVIWDYQIKGFLKDAIKMLRQDPDSACSKITAYKGKIDGLVFVTPRQIVLELPEGTKMGTCERPLRAQTMQGERVALASSEEAPAGTTIHFEVTTLAPGLDKALDECWKYANLRFMGAWRNSGKGTAVVEEVVSDKSATDKKPKKGKKAD